MPGVPSGRGCDACRSQKKKCDQAKPSCSRCERLQIICLRSGQQRYKFMHENDAPTFSNDQRQFSVTVSQPISNAQTLLTGALIDKLKLSTDLRYNLPWAYGGYLEDIPRRMGRSDALDAAVDALVYAHSQFAGAGREVCPKSLQKYNHAIAILRVSLDDPVQARSADTLCIVTLLLLRQVFNGVYEGFFATSRCEGAAQILKVRGYYDKNDEFERKLLLALCGSVVSMPQSKNFERDAMLTFAQLFHALLSDKVPMSFTEWKQIVENDLDGASYEGRMMGCLARVPDLMQAGRDALQGGHAPVKLQKEAKCLHDATKLILRDLRYRFLKQEADPASSVVAVMVHCHYQRTYALALVISIILNCILDALDPREVILEEEAAQCSKEILVLAETAAVYRPIAASYMSLCLIAALGCSKEEGMKSAVKRKLEDYLQDFSYTKVVVSTAELDAIFRLLRLKGRLRPSTHERGDDRIL